jgi:carbon-monoxide dehydrogenase large subunit
MFVIERLIDLAAEDLGLDRIEIRRKNLAPVDAMPFANGLGLTYDDCDFAEAMDAVLVQSGWDGFAARRAEARARGRLRGIGFANYVEIAAGALRERSDIAVLGGEGVVEVVIGTLASGQSHETTFAQLVTSWLGVPGKDVRLVTGDTDRVQVGGGSHAGRSMRLAAVVMGAATAAIIEKGRRVAAHLLDGPVEEVSFADGVFALRGSNRTLGLFEVARAAEAGDGLPADLGGGLAATSDQTAPDGGYPYGAQVCEVEVDPDTGAVAIIRYAAFDDVGRAINPMVVHGQTHGGIVQGVGQALMEHCRYDLETGQLLAGSFMDYAMPRADMLPSFDTEIGERPAPGNPLGVRPGGEGGTTPALAVVINAIVDALSEFGVRHLEMPATPERVWQAIHGRRSGL